MACQIWYKKITTKYLNIYHGVLTIAHGLNRGLWLNRGLFKCVELHKTVSTVYKVRIKKIFMPHSFPVWRKKEGLEKRVMASCAFYKII
ncbi:MAG: hypothetical protein KKE39_11195 [Bacteroidetes bacterium]|nr:hypothetical protein [Bacteroidota bacterium]